MRLASSKLRDWRERPADARPLALHSYIRNVLVYNWCVAPRSELSGYKLSLLCVIVCMVLSFVHLLHTTPCVFINKLYYQQIHITAIILASFHELGLHILFFVVQRHAA
jgi:hypothetical protein